MHLDWVLGLAGGVLIGTASAILLLFNGRVAGISGIAGRFMSPLSGDRRADWQSGLFLAGLVIGPVLLALVTEPPSIEITGDTAMLIAGGLLVGFGTRLGNGCTSGHGVCGLSRGAIRSVVAVAIFMTVAALTVLVLRHGVGGAT